MKLQSLFDLAQKVTDVEPLHTTVIQQVTGAQINRLQNRNSYSSSPSISCESISTSADRFECFLVLPEQVVKDGPVLFVYPLHLVDVFRHSLHPEEGVDEGLVGLAPAPLFAGRTGSQVLQLLQEQGVLEDPLNRLDQVGLE